MVPQGPIVSSGECCWKCVRADAVGFIIDGEAYFRAVREMILSAEETVYVLAWDFHSRVTLERDTVDDDFPVELGALINAALEARPALHIYVLLWDFSIIYLAEREWRFASKWLRDPHPRLHFRRDDKLPKGASHHQKIVVTDDSVAFCSGLDLSIWRWDTSEHKAGDPRRKDPSGKPYGPYHDLGMAVDGEAARALSELFHERWQRIDGDALPPIRKESRALWPSGIERSMEGVDVGIARTLALDPDKPVLEIESLHLEMIRQARRFLFIENQYFSSNRIAEALMERLREEDGPEILLLLTQDTDGWMEEGTMGLMRDRLLEKLAAADNHDRFAVLSAHVEGEDGEPVQVYMHAKLVIADDRIIKIGSSNLSNRSMRVDTECDLFIERDEADAAIAAFRHSLLAMHLGVTAEAFAATEEKEGSLLAAVRQIEPGKGRRLKPFEYDCDSDAKRRLADSQLLDPDEPVDPGFWIRKRLPEAARPSVWRRTAGLAGILLFALAIGILLQSGWGPFSSKEEMLELLRNLRESPWTPLAIIGLFLLGGTLGIPLNLILVSATLVVGPWAALGYGIIGTLGSACAGFALGHLFGKPLIRWIASSKLDLINEKLGQSGIWPVAFVRIVPVAPFLAINLVAGSSHIPFRKYVIGTAIGLLPGMSAVVFLTHEAETVVRDPQWDNVLLLVLACAVVLGAIAILYRALSRRASASEK